MAPGDEMTILLRDSDMEVQVSEDRGGGLTLGFISQDGSIFLVKFSKRDYDRFVRFVAGEDEEDDEDEEPDDDGEDVHPG